MLLIFVDRKPTEHEIQKFRLILSTYQDGTGQLAAANNMTLPGWRDFERSVALAFGGEAQESKAIFDVLLPDPRRQGFYYGISCKMRNTLKIADKIGRVTIELSNSAGKFWGELRVNELNEGNYQDIPEKTGKVLIELVERWHNAVSIYNGGNVDLTGSFYLTLQWDEKFGDYQLYQFPLKLPNPADLNWQILGRRLIGSDSQGVLFEWYGHSGGQLKYYPLATSAIWVSSRFKLEPLPEREVGYGILRKVTEYFPEQWEEVLRKPMV